MTAIIMTVAILVVYKVARALDWALSLPALVGCGVCALLINFLSIPVAPFLTEYRFTVLGAMILIAAIVITGINHFFIRKRRKQLEATNGDNIQQEQDTIPAEEELVPVVNSAILSSEEVESLIAKDKAQEPVGQAEPEPAIETVVEEEIPEPVIEAVGEEEAPKEAEVETVVEEEAPEAEPKPEPSPSVDEKLADTATLDDVLDYAFELKGSSDWSSALKAYNYALEQYRDDAYAPFLVLEIVNIHKDHGRYDEAIQCFYDALEIPAVADSPDMLAEFEDSMIYLEATKEVLIAENQPDTPFFDIPKDYMSKIESIYNERKARSI